MLFGRAGLLTSPEVTVEVNTDENLGTTWTDILQVWRSSQFLGPAVFGTETPLYNNGKINVVGNEAKVNIGYGDGGGNDEKLNVRGNILSFNLKNEGPGIDINFKPGAEAFDQLAGMMLCADTNGKIVLCKDIDIPEIEEEEEEEEDSPLTVELTYVSDHPQNAETCAYVDRVYHRYVTGVDMLPVNNWWTSSASIGSPTPIVTYTLILGEEDGLQTYRIRIFRDSVYPIIGVNIHLLVSTPDGETDTVDDGSTPLIDPNYCD